MSEPLIDCHAHFLHGGCGRSDWEDVNAARFRAGEAIGVTCHVASILGTLRLHVADLLSVAGRRDAGQRRDARAVPARGRARAHDGDREPQPHGARAGGDRALRRRGRDRGEARWRAGAPTIRCSIRSARSRRGTGCRCCITSGSTAAANGRTRRSPTAHDLARLAARHPRRHVHPRAHRRWRRLRAHVPGGAGRRRTSIPTSPAAASIAACSTTRSGRSARDACCGGATSRCAPDSPSCARWRRPGLLGADDLRDIRWRNAARIFRRGVVRGRGMIDVNALIGAVSVPLTCRTRNRTCSCACSIARGSSGRGSGTFRRRSIATRRRATPSCSPRSQPHARAAAGRCPRSGRTGRDGRPPCATRANAGRGRGPRVSAAVAARAARCRDGGARRRVRRARSCRSCSPCASRTCASGIRSTSRAT